MKKRTGRIFVWAVALAAGLAAFGAPVAGPKDYVREEVKVPGLPSGARLVSWTKKGLMPGRAWTVRFDLKDPRWRIVTRLGLTNDRSATNRVATLDAMAAALDAEGRHPVVGVNGNYFDAHRQEVSLYGPLVSDGRVLVEGGGNLLVETEDHAFFLGGGNRISAKGGAFAANGRRILNATGFYAEPTIRYDRGKYATTDNPTYPRTLVGIGDGVLVFLVSDGRQPLWSLGVADRDAVDMLVAEGCQTVAEGDGGGSSALWIRDLPKELTPRDRNYVNKPSDGRPRKVAEGVFMTWTDLR